MKLSVVVPTYNRRDVLARTLPTIFAQTCSGDEYEVVVVVDGSEDETDRMLQSLTPTCGFQVIRQNKRGSGAARNAGVSVSRGEIVLFLDDDCLCEPTLVAEHIAAHATNPGSLIIGPVFLAGDVNGSPVAELVREVALREFERVQRSGVGEADAVVCANSSLGRDVLIACGGFDPEFQRCEDIEFGIRLRKVGVPVKFQPTAVAHQVYVKTARHLVRVDAARWAIDELALCRKHPGYRQMSAMARLASGPWWKSVFRHLACASRISPEPLVAVLYAIAERLSSIRFARRLGVRLLCARMAIEFWRTAQANCGSWRSLKREFGVRLPVLLYHRIGPSRHGCWMNLTVLPKVFEKQMRLLSRRGYTAISPSDWLAWCQEGKLLPEKPVLLTFDDAYADTAEYAFPVLSSLDFSAGVLVVTKYIGEFNKWDQPRWASLRLMSAEDIRLWATRGIEFGGHSRSHVDLTTLSTVNLVNEIQGSTDDLSKVLGRGVYAFAYPYGLYNDTVRAVAQKYSSLAFGPESGINTLATDRWRLRRTEVAPNDNPIDVMVRLYMGWHPKERLRLWLKRIINRRESPQARCRIANLESKA